MLAAISSAGIVGIDAYAVTVEVDAAAGLPQWTIVGLPLGAVKESRERVGAALVHSGFTLPPRRITINLAPADIKKDGTAFDLPIAIGILVATGQLSPHLVEKRIFVGELGLDGSIRAVKGALSIARFAASTTVRRELVIPHINLAEAGRVSALRVAAPDNLRALVVQLQDNMLTISSASPRTIRAPSEQLDFSDVAGQQSAKRALEVAAAGGHNMYMVGPPGAGKTMLARRLPGILPELTEAESLEVIAIHSVAGILTADALASWNRPFRAPHHSISTAGLIGGGTNPRPGEVSLAHNGVLFLDEMLEFPRSVLDGLRQPMEDGCVVISRAASSVKFPARFTLVGATNPCPCGRLGDSTGTCTCSASDLDRYSARISGPLADRMDMHVTVGAVPLSDLAIHSSGDPTAAIRSRVLNARARQTERFANLPGIGCNAHSTGRWMDANGDIGNDARVLLHRAASTLAMSARGYHRVLKIARTIADIDGDKLARSVHVSEALRYRPVNSTRHRQ